MSEYWVNSLSQLYDAALRKSISFFKEDNFYIFRGQADSSWSLIPSIFRGYLGLPSTNRMEVPYTAQNLADKASLMRNISELIYLDSSEKSIYEQFFERIRGYGQLRIDYTNPWEMLCLAQHFGVPTRLLDWTSNLNVAAYLCVAEAVRDKAGDKKNGSIWCLNVTETAAHVIPDNENIDLEIHYNKQAGVSRIDDLPQVTSFFPSVKEDTFQHSGYGFRIVRAPAIEDRMKSQSGFFTVDVTQRAPWVTEQTDAATHYDHFDLCSDYLLKIIIPAEAKEFIKDDLEKLGIDYSVLFPDLFGLGKYFQDLLYQLIPRQFRK